VLFPQTIEIKRTILFMLKLIRKSFLNGLLVALIMVGTNFQLYGQKDTLRYQSILDWPQIERHSIKVSGNGKHIIYRVDYKSGKSDLILQAIGQEWKRKLPRCTEARFTEDGKFALFLNQNDSLGIFDLKQDSVTYIWPVISYTTPAEGNGQWLAYYEKGKEKTLRIANLLTNEVRKYSHAGNYFFDSKGEHVAMSLDGGKGVVGGHLLIILDLLTDKEDTISKCYPINSLVFDEFGTKVAFLTKESAYGGNVTAIKFYKQGMDSAIKIVDSLTLGMSGNEISGNTLFFSDNGDKLFFRLKRINYMRLPEDINNNEETVIWNSGINQSGEFYARYSYASVCLNGSSRVIPFRQDDPFIRNLLVLDQSNNEQYALVETCSKYNSKSVDRDTFTRKDYYLVETISGRKKLIIANLPEAYVSFSFRGNYIIWYDRDKGHWFTYQVQRGIIKDITKNIPVPLNVETDYPTNLYQAAGIAGWLENDRFVLIYDDYDIWKVDPEGVAAPYNLTEGYGRRNNTHFRNVSFFGNRSNRSNSRPPVAIGSNDTLLLAAFNSSAKSNGFFSLSLRGNNSLKKLCMGSSVFYYWPSTPPMEGLTTPIVPVKAKHEKLYIIQRMNDSEFPNLYYTTNFREFGQLTNFEPQKTYLWYKSENIKWKLPNGRQMEGILYKPEDFDPQRKYPVIFHIYERSSDFLHFFINPDLCNGIINIPWFVNRGYLVFVPDIFCYKPGYPGECAYQAVESAARFLLKFPWVDARRLGLQGHSYGAWETNYVITHSHLFAAAATAGGYTDLMSNYGDWNQLYYMNGQGRIGASLGDRPDLYQKNSPILETKRVSAPLLIMHSKDDSRVPFYQDMQWYNDLSWLKKKVWLISYGADDHVLRNEKNQLDYTIRLTEFFDYYLKGANELGWMKGY